MQIEVGEDLWRDLLIFPSSLNTTLPSGQCKDIDRGSGGRWSFGCRFWALKQPVKTTKNLNDYHIKSVFWICLFSNVCVFSIPCLGSTLRQFDFHIFFKCLVKPTPSKRYVHSTPSMCTKQLPPVLRRFKVIGVCFVNGKSCLDTWRPQLPDICCVRSTFE